MNEPTDRVIPAAAADIAATNQSETSSTPELIEDELLVEEISIDGMCGVY